MDTSKIIKGVVNPGRYTVTAPIVKEDYGLYLQIEGVELPQTYEVDFSNSENSGTSVTMIGNADGVLIPHQFIDTGKDIFAFLYHVGANYGRTVYKFRIPNKCRPDRTDDTPTPEEQSVIDQAISALNSAVAQTAQDVIDADASAQSASQSAENAHDSAVDAQNYAESASGYASDAQGYANTASAKVDAILNLTATASVDDSTGTPSVDVTVSDVGDHKNMDFDFSGLKAEEPVTLRLAKDTIYVPMDTEYRTKVAVAENIWYEYFRGDKQIDGIMDYSGTLAGTNITCTNAAACTPTQDGRIYFNIPKGVPLRTNSDVQMVVNFRFVFDYNDLDGTRRTIIRNINFVGVMDGEKGDKGDAPTITASKTGDTTSIFADGAEIAQIEDGEKGTDGVSPTVSVSTITGGHRITITDADGSHSADVMDGDDYVLTSEDKAEIAEIVKPQVEDDILKAFPTDTASGSIASFSDGADNLPLKSLVVDINPIQDLHGQDAPYPAGGGKNILPYASKDTDSKNGVTWTKNSDGSITFSGTCSASTPMTFVEFKLPAGDYLFSNVGSTFAYTGGNRPTVYIRDLDNSLSLAGIGFGKSANGDSFSLSAETNIRFYVVFQTDNVVSGVLYPMIRLASVTDATYAPYENLCPISGWTEVGVEQRGVNVWDEEWEVGSIDADTGQPTPSSNNIRSKNFIQCVPNTVYKALCSTYVYLRYYDGDKNYVRQYQASGARLFTTPNNCHYFKFVAGSAYGTTYNHDISINYPSTDHDYHPYTGRSITISLGQTVYGGKLDVLSGELVIERYFVDPSQWTRYTANNGYIAYRIRGIPKGRYGNDTMNMPLSNMIANFGGFSSSAMSKNIIQPPRINANTAHMALQDGIDPTTVELSYLIANPLAIQLTPNQVNSLLGVNNIWADSGDTMAEYRADTKLYIAKKISEVLASLT